MANVQTKDVFVDLGQFKNKKCNFLRKINVCVIKFQHGKITLTKRVLDEIFKD